MVITHPYIHIIHEARDIFSLILYKNLRKNEKKNRKKVEKVDMRGQVGYARNDEWTEVIASFSRQRPPTWNPRPYFSRQSEPTTKELSPRVDRASAVSSSCWGSYDDEATMQIAIAKSSSLSLSTATILERGFYCHLHFCSSHLLNKN